MSKVSFIKSDDRKYNVSRVLSLIKSEITAGLKDAKKVVIKPNCVVTNTQLAATHKDALEALLEFIRPYVRGQIILAEGTGIGNTIEAFKNYGYLDLQDKFDLEIIDLNTDESEKIELIDRKGNNFSAEIAKTIAQSDYIISISPPKTHNFVVYTGAIKNTTIGALPSGPSSHELLRLAKKFLLGKRNNKELIHQGKNIHQNIKRIFERLSLKLAILDGFETMEGNGPLSGDLVATHFALASTDPVAADVSTCRCLGINPDDCGYLSMLAGKEENYFVVGDDWEKNVFKIAMHPNFEKIRQWK